MLCIPAVGGSSPRGRGTLALLEHLVAAQRFIPAWAGNTESPVSVPLPPPVHPRVGGEHHPDGWLAEWDGGSSPRGRGTRTRSRIRSYGGRFIPAWAGNTPFSHSSMTRPAVHPRVGGEHAHVPALAAMVFGSSPRGRGTRKPPDAFGLRHRFIPVWAGNTTASTRISARATVHPRVGGEHPWPLPRTLRSERFIPAWAGNTAQLALARIGAPVHPRVGGEHRLRNASRRPAPGSSPRGRGTPEPDPREGHAGRFIPAWAGNTAGPVCARCPRSVHPRVGGEHLEGQRVAEYPGGSSPRGRGTPTPSTYRTKRLRFIPAWAGNTWSRASCAPSESVHPRVGGEHP